MRIKYPRTFHLPFSPGATSDDKVLKNTEHFLGREVVITMKMDGENTTLYNDGFHARSIDSRHHPSRDWLAKFHGTMSYKIPVGWRICGENLYARHSVEYTELLSYFLGFSLWEGNTCLSWDDTILFFDAMDVTAVDVLWRGVYADDIAKAIANDFDRSVNEGFVVRLADSFQYEDFNTSVAKWVRPNHVTTDTHWMHQRIVPNSCKQ